MERSRHYDADVLFFFEGKPVELSLYEAFFDRMCRQFPDASVKVQKSQISFYQRHLFAAASVPIRRKKIWPEHCLLVTFGLSHRLESPRIAAAVEPYPNRWTHHVLLTAPEEIDDELMGWLEASCAFSRSKR